MCGLPCDDAVHRWGACLPRLSAHLLPHVFGQRVLLPFAGVPGCCQLPEHEALALRAAQSAMTLLQNIDGALPLTGAELAGELFLGGPLGNATGALNGGYAGTPAHTVTLLEGLAAELKQAGGSVAFQAGCTNGVQCTDTSQFAAAVAAATGKVAILAMGIDDSVESEGRDRTSIGLPGYQEDLIVSVAAVAKKTVLVLVNGGGIRLSAAVTRNVHAILEAFQPAQSGGTAVAATLSGASAPAGRMPYTVPMVDADLPPITNYDMNATINGTWLGRSYRYAQPAPQYPFGYGLSYTSWSYSDLVLSSAAIGPCDNITVTFTVHNTGEVPSDEVAQVYLGWPAGAGDTNWPELRGFERIKAVPASGSAQVQARRMGAGANLGQIMPMIYIRSICR